MKRALWVLLAVGCGDEQEATKASLPNGLRMEGRAEVALEGGGIGECSMNLLFELREEVSRDDDQVVYKGVHGGELFRSVREADDSGLAFFIDVYSEVEVRLVLPDRLEIDINVNRTNGESRFYDHLAELRGVISSAGTAVGAWTCAPLDIDNDGYVDDHVFATGTWSTRPEEIPPPEEPEDDLMVTQ